MARIRTTGTDAEMPLRRELHRRGLRYRVNFQIPGLGRRVRPDIVFTRQRICVLVDGCFWHQCPDHATRPQANQHWWSDKLDGNVRRDRQADRLLSDAGWTVIRIWEHVGPIEGAEEVESVVRGPNAMA